MIYLIVIGSILVLLGLFFFYFPFLKALRYKRMFVSLIQLSSNFGYIIAITGKIRAGKSTLMYGLSHVFTFVLQEKMSKILLRIEELLPEIPFVKLKVDFRNKLNEYTLDKAIDLILIDYLLYDDMGNTDLKYNLNDVIFNNLKYENKIDLIKLYLETLSYSFRSNFILSDTKMYNQIFANYSLNFSPSWFKIKENNEFPFTKYMIICNDDKLLTDSNVNAIRKLNADDGSSIVYRLLGNGFEETVYFICTVQDFNRWVKHEREIATSIINVEKSYLACVNSRLMKLIEIYRNFISFLYRLKCWFIRKFKDDNYLIDYQDSFNIFRRILKKLRLKEEKIISKSFIIFDTTIYNQVENVGKKITSEMEDKGNYYFTFVIPVIYCWDIGNTFYFKPLFDYLINRSKIKNKDLNKTEIDMDFISKILKKTTSTTEDIYNDDIINSSDNIF